MKIFKRTGKDGSGPVAASPKAAVWGPRKEARPALSTPGLSGEVRRQVAATKLTEALRLRERSAQTESAFRVQREPEASAGPRADPAVAVETPAAVLAGLGSGEALIQRKKTIEGSQHFPMKGDLAIDMEERLRGNSGGAYGVISFTPDANEGTDADKIDLVQIASMTTNKRGQAQYRQEEIDESVTEDHNETSGTPAVKDLWRIGGEKRYHMDLTGDKLKPRRGVDDRAVEEAYNSERRYGQWEDPIDEVTMGEQGGPVLDNYHAKGKPNTRTFKINQEPGFRHGADIRPAQLHDFPSGPDPAVFSFHTTVDADGQPWGTVQWGFSTVLNYSDDIEIDKVEGPTFHAEQAEEMTQARRQFDKIMANPRSWSSPEALEDAKGYLASEDDPTYEKGQDTLFYIAEALLDAFTRIDEIKDKAIFKRFVLPHLERADAVLELMGKHGMSHLDEYSQLDAAFKELSGRHAED
jgi:hypothetical protein